MGCLFNLSININTTKNYCIRDLLLIFYSDFSLINKVFEQTDDGQKKEKSKINYNYLIIGGSFNS